MTILTDVAADSAGAPGFFNSGSPTLTANRMYVWTGTTPTPAAPAAGGDVDFIAGSSASYFDVGLGTTVTVAPTCGYLALPGLPVMVEAGAAFASGASLQTDANGRAVTVTTGKAVLRALQAAAGAGSIVAAVFTSGR